MGAAAGWDAAVICAGAGVAGAGAAAAGADLYMRDPAKGQQAQALLAQFGVQAVTQLPKERYGEFATALRGLGANL